MHLLQIDHLAIHIKPDAGVSFEGRLVLPPLMRGAIAGHDGQPALEWVVCGRLNLRGSGQKIPRVSQWIPDHRLQVNPAPPRLDGREPELILRLLGWSLDLVALRHGLGTFDDKGLVKPFNGFAS